MYPPRMAASAIATTSTIWIFCFSSGVICTQEPYRSSESTAREQLGIECPSRGLATHTSPNDDGRLLPPGVRLAETRDRETSFRVRYSRADSREMQRTSPDTLTPALPGQLQLERCLRLVSPSKT